MLNTFFKALKSAHIISSKEAEPTSTTNGVNINIDTSTIESSVGSYWGWVEHRLNNIVVPDLILPSDTEQYMKRNDFTVYQSINNIYYENDLANNRFCFDLYDLNGKFITEEFHAHHGVLGAHGAAHITMDETHLGVCYHAIVQTLPDGRQVPGISATAADFGWDLTKHNLGFHASGSFWDGFIDMFKNLFEDDICNALINKVRDELINAVPAEINKMIADTDGTIEILPKWIMQVWRPV